MANEYTLADFERMAKSTLEQTVIKTWRETSPIMDMLKFKQASALSIEFLRTTSLPLIPWRNYDDSFTQLKINTERVTEQVHFLGAKIDIPKALVLAGSVVDQRKLQEQAFVEGLARSFNNGFFNGDPTLDNLSVIGLRFRATSALAAAQTVAGGALDISSNTAVTTWHTQLFNLVEDLLSRLDGGTADALFMSRLTKLRFEAAMRESGMKSTTEDKTGKRYPSYGEGGPRLIDPGYIYDDSTAILTDAETAAGVYTGGVVSSIFACKFGEPYVAGFYEYPINVDDVGLLEDRINYRTVVEWSPGIYMVHPRSVAWLVNLTVA